MHKHAAKFIVHVRSMLYVQKVDEVFEFLKFASGKNEHTCKQYKELTAAEP